MLTSIDVNFIFDSAFLSASLGDKDVLLAASRQDFKFCTWFISSKMCRSTEDIKIRNLRKDINRNYNQSRDVKTNRK